MKKNNINEEEEINEYLYEKIIYFFNKHRIKLIVLTIVLLFTFATIRINNIINNPAIDEITKAFNKNEPSTSVETLISNYFYINETSNITSFGNITSFDTIKFVIRFIPLAITFSMMFFIFKMFKRDYI